MFSAMPKELLTAEAVFDALGGISGVAEILGAKRTAVTNWKMAGSFPARTYSAFYHALRERNCIAPADLWRMRPLPKHNAR